MNKKFWLIVFLLSLVALPAFVYGEPIIIANTGQNTYRLNTLIQRQDGSQWTMFNNVSDGKSYYSIWNTTDKWQTKTLYTSLQVSSYNGAGGLSLKQDGTILINYGDGTNIWMIIANISSSNIFNIMVNQSTSGHAQYDIVPYQNGLGIFQAFKSGTSQFAMINANGTSWITSVVGSARSNAGGNARLTNGTLVIYYSDENDGSGSYNIYVSMTGNNGTTWTNPMSFPSTSMAKYSTGGRFSVIADGNASVALVDGKNGTDIVNQIYVLRLNATNSSVYRLTNSTKAMTQPQLRRDTAGNWYAFYSNTTYWSAGDACFMQKSYDLKTWTTPVVIATGCSYLSPRGKFDYIQGDQLNYTASPILDFVYVNNTMGTANILYSSTNISAYDAIPPHWSNISTVPASPVTKNNTSPINVTFNITVTDNVAVDTVQVRHVGHIHATTEIGNIYTFQDEIACGTTNYGWNINDTSGNTNNTPNFDFQINCGTTEPTILITSPVGTYNSTTVPLVFTSYNNETIDTCWFTVDDSNLQIIPICYNQTLANVSITFVTTEGSHHADVYANDTFGITNFSTTYFVVDVSAPSISVSSPSGISGSTAFTVLYIVSDTGNGLNTTSCYYLTDYNITHVALPLCASGSGTAPTGTHLLSVFASDLAGNQNYGTTSFTIGLPPAVQGTTAVIYNLVPLLFSLLILFGGTVSIIKGTQENNKDALVIGAVMIIIGLALLGVTASIVHVNTSVQTA